LVTPGALVARRGLWPAVVVVGIGGGLIGAAYVTALHALTDVLGPDDHTGLVQIGVLVAVGLAVAGITRLGGPAGDVELLVDNIHVLGGADDVKRLRTLVPASLLCVSAGGAMGPEAPLVQSCGTFGTWISSRLNRSVDETRILTITGMAAAFAVLFGAPLGAAFFALEILHRRGLQYYEALVPALVGSLSGYGIYLVLTQTGIGPVWDFPAVGDIRGADLVVAIGLGLLGAAGACLFVYGARAARGVLRHIPPSARLVAGGLCLGLLALWSPYTLTFGEEQLTVVLNGRLTMAALAVALAAKLLGTTITLSTGWKGGFIIPLFFMGAVGGQMLHHEFPGANESLLMAGLMVALCVGVTKTPVGTTLVVTEMAGLALLPVTIIAAVVALLATTPLAMIDTQRSRADPERQTPPPPPSRVQPDEESASPA
jgi:H+/Cl- antiporter ClcA